MAKFTLSQVAEKQAELLEDLKALPATDTSKAILDLLKIQVYMAHIMADIINKGGNDG